MVQNPMQAFQTKKAPDTKCPMLSLSFSYVVLEEAVISDDYGVFVSRRTGCPYCAEL